MGRKAKNEVLTTIKEDQKRLIFTTIQDDNVLATITKTEWLDLLLLVTALSERAYGRRRFLWPCDKLLRLFDQECSGGKIRAPFSVLHYAVRRGHADYVKLLLGIDKELASILNDKGETALHHAAQMGDALSIRNLVDLGNSDVVTHSKCGDLPICLAIRGGHLPAVEYMLDHSRRTSNLYFDKKQPHRLMAAAVAHPEILRVLAHHCCAIENRPVPTSKLMFDVAISGKAGAVDVLIDAGLDIKTQSSEDGSSAPLHHAAKAGNAEVIRALLHHGASVDAKDNTGQTPLHWVVKSENLTSDKVAQIAKLLTESGANVEAVDSNGDTPTSLARQGDPQPTGQLLAVLSGARADQSWCYRRAVILYKKQLEQESLRALMTKLVNIKEKDVLSKVLGFL